MNKWKCLSCVLLIGIAAALIMGAAPVTNKSSQQGLILVRAEADEDAGTLAGVLDLTTVGDFDNKPAGAFDHEPDKSGDGPTNVEYFFMAGDAAEKTFKAVGYAYIHANGPAERVCTLSCTTGSQAVVVFPAAVTIPATTGTTATSRFWVDTITVDTQNWGVSVEVPAVQNDDNVCSAIVDFLGRRHIIWLIYEADGTTGTEAGDVSVYGKELS